MEEFLAKAEESLAGAEAELAANRYNNCANRAYYACFQAAMYALWHAGIRPPGSGVRWNHDFVQAEFVGRLINRRKLYPPELRDTLHRSYDLREIADYKTRRVTAVEAHHVVRRSRDLVRAVRQRTGGAAMTTKTIQQSRRTRFQAALAELQRIIAEKYPDAEFCVRRGNDDPREWWLEVTVDLEDTEEVTDLVIDRLLDYQIEQRLPIYVLPLRSDRAEALVRQRELEQSYARGKWVPSDYRRMREAAEREQNGSTSN